MVGGGDVRVSVLADGAGVSWGQLGGDLGGGGQQEDAHRHKLLPREPGRL